MAQQHGPIPGLDQVVLGLAQVNTAAPLIFAAVAVIRSIWKSSTGQEIDLSQYADLIDAQLAATDEKGKANAEYFRQLIAERGQ